MTTINRRSFLNTTALSGLALARTVNAQEEAKKWKIGVIGCGWFGNVDLNNAYKAADIDCIAICDVDTEHLRETADTVEEKQGTRPLEYKHYEEMLDNNEFDFIIIATPPQWHALPFIAACKRGIDIYCEKPLSYDVREGRAMVDAARKAGNIVQIGFQRRQSAAVNEARQYIREGNAGEIVQIDANIHYTAGLKDTTHQDPPASLDWDLWCGPAPKLPYTPNIGHFNWRLEKEYGNGHLVDWGIHWIDSIRMVMGETTPKKIQASGGLYHLDGKITTPDTMSAHFEFDSVPVHWRHRLWGSAEYDGSITNGVFYYGTKETIFVNDGRWEIIPQDKNAERKVMEPKNEVASGVAHMREFIDAVIARKQPSCPVDDGYQSTATVQLGMIAYESGGTIHWDAFNEEIKGNSRAARKLKREYRAPWQHPYMGI